MNDFEKRLAPHEEWAAKVFAHIAAQGWRTVPLGAERIAPGVQKALSAMQSPDPTARFVRYMPDGFAVNIGAEKAYFFDAKCGRTIEKDAFQAYKAFAGDDRSVFVCIRWQETIYWIPVRAIVFLDSIGVVSEFAIDHRMPIDEDDWIAPRLWPREKYIQWKYRHPGASGTAFRYVDFEAMAQYRYAAPDLAR